ncbi:MAG: glycine cleavage system protein H, partial [Candidatus Bathyarchaeia archaeon]
DEPFGVAESWWFTYDLYSPLDGKIIAVNERIAEDPLSLNAVPSTWIVKVQPENTKTWANDMLSPQKYHELTASPQ